MKASFSPPGSARRSGPVHCVWVCAQLGRCNTEPQQGEAGSCLSIYICLLCNNTELWTKPSPAGSHTDSPQNHQTTTTPTRTGFNFIIILTFYLCLSFILLFCVQVMQYLPYKYGIWKHKEVVTDDFLLVLYYFVYLNCFFRLINISVLYCNVEWSKCLHEIHDMEIKASYCVNILS